MLLKNVNGVFCLFVFLKPSDFTLLLFRKKKFLKEILHFFNNKWSFHMHFFAEKLNLYFSEASPELMVSCALDTNGICEDNTLNLLTQANIT